jgi:hypothetical protein
MTTIQIAETVHPSHTPETGGDLSSPILNDGIYNMRTISRVSSKDRRSLEVRESEVEDDDPGLRRSGDFKTRQVRRQIHILRYPPLLMHARFSMASCCYGFHISQLVSSTATLGPVHSTCSPQRSAHHQITLISWAFCQLSFGLLP